MLRKKCGRSFLNLFSPARKKVVLRLADFEVNEGDELVLKEWDPKTKDYTGREVSTTVTYVTKTKNQGFWPQEDVEKYGFQIIQFDKK